MMYIHSSMYWGSKAESEDLEGVAPDHGPQFGALDIGQDAEQPEVVGEQVT